MYVSHLSLVDYRSYEHVDIEFAPGVNVLVGHNGQGKTNIVEAIGYLATLASHRVAHDTALIRVGAQRALIRSRVVRGDRAQVVELELLHGKANKARVNRGQPGRASTVLGIVKTVVFAPEDLVLVKGDPDARRRYLDDLTVLMIPRMRSVLADYDKVVRQRSALLKQLMRGALRMLATLRWLCGMNEWWRLGPRSLVCASDSSLRLPLTSRPGTKQ